METIIDLDGSYRFKYATLCSRFHESPYGNLYDFVESLVGNKAKLYNIGNVLRVAFVNADYASMMREVWK